MQQNSPSLSVSVIFSSSDADAVINLNTDPGSYVSDIALFLHIACKSFVFSDWSKLSQFASNSALFIVYGSFKL